MMRGARIGRWTAVVVMAVGATLSVTALAGASMWLLAKHLVDKDPGARVGGNTIVVTGKGDRVFGVPGRRNFIVALGSGETISAGSRDSELGALGKHDTIIVGHSHELIVGGPDDKIIAKGKGHDLVIDTHSDATVELESPDDKVIVTGHHDHVICSGNSFGDRIHDGAGDTVSKTCVKDHDQVKQDAQALMHPAHVARRSVARAASVGGDGSNDNPYWNFCDQEPNVPLGSSASCAVSFPERTLSGFWANETVPAYRCPTSGNFYRNFPYLVDQNYAPAGTSLRNGVEVQGLGPIGVTIVQISSSSELYHSTGHFYATGTRTDASSATSWTLGSASYHVVLHCTNDALHSGY